MKYRKKPVVIDAVQWTGENYNEICKFVGSTLNYPDSNRNDLIIETLEGPHIAAQTDYIIKGIHGEFYPCKSDIFIKTYEPVQVPNEDWNTLVDDIASSVFGTKVQYLICKGEMKGE